MNGLSICHERIRHARCCSKPLLLLTACVVVAISFCRDVPLHAQNSDDSTTSLTVDERQTLHVSTHGLSRYLPSRWGTLLVEATNYGNDATEVNAVVWIEGGEEQAARSVWLPGSSRRISSMPVFIHPRPYHPGDPGPVLNWMGVRDSAGREVLLRSDKRDHIETRELIMPRAQRVFAVVSDGTTRELELAELLRFTFGNEQLQSVVLTIESGQTPVIPEAIDAVSTLVVMGNRLAQDAAAVEAVQEWVRRGGTLWLMLDMMSEESARIIGGSDLPVYEVDRTSLTSYSLNSTSNSAAPDPDIVDLEQPVQLVRTFADESSILSEANDWPAAVAVPFGQGRILASMLSLDGWFVPRRIRNLQESEHQEDRLWITTAGHDLMSSLGGVGTEIPLKTDDMTEYVRSRIGYQLPARFHGAVVLTTFCIVLIMICGIAHRLQKPALLLPGVAVLSCLVAGAFLAMAASSHTTPDGSVTFQLVEAEGTQDRLMASGVVAFHSRDLSTPDIRSSAGGRFEFLSSINSGIPVRTVWTDEDHWRLKNVNLSSGVTFADFQQPVRLRHPVQVLGTFDESGFKGRLAGDLNSQLQDALLAGQTGFTLPVEIDLSGEIRSRNAEPLPPGQYLSTGFVDAEQKRRQDTYRRLFDVSQRRRIYPQSMTLLAWSDPMKLRTGPDGSSPSAGAMLITIPVVVQRPKAGQRVRIPSTFLPYRSVRNRQLKIGYAPTFNNSRRTWTTNTTPGPSNSLLQFQIPDALQPLLVDRAKLILKISAPLRNVEILSGHPDSLVSVWSRDSPVGRFEIPFTESRSRQLDSTGAFLVALKVGRVQLDELEQSEMGSQDRNWQIEWIQLEMEGLIQ